MRILYVEDNPANISLLQRIARMGGHDVVSYNDGEKALSNFESDKPDLILMDLQLAGALNGLDVVKRLRSDGVTTPIVAVTAYAMVGDKERCIEAGCDGYLAKPLPVAELVETVQKYEQALISKEAAPDSTETTAVAEVKAGAPEAAKKPEPVPDSTESDRSKVIRGTTPLPDLAKKAAARKAAKDKKDGTVRQSAKPGSSELVDKSPPVKPEPSSEPVTPAAKIETETQTAEKAPPAPTPQTAEKAPPTPTPQTAEKAPITSPAHNGEVKQAADEAVRIAIAGVKVDNGKKE